MMKIERIEFLLQSFCGTVDGRNSMSKPFRVGEHVYATDSRRVIRPDQAVSLELATGNLPDVLRLGWGKLKDPVVEVPVVELPETPEQDECKTCGGTGEVTCEYDHDHECPECKGAGAIWPKIELPIVPFDHVMLHPDTAVILRAMCVDARPGKPVAFSGDGFEGLMMPCMDSEALRRGTTHLSGERIRDARALIAALTTRSEAKAGVQ